MNSTSSSSSSSYKYLLLPSFILMALFGKLLAFRNQSTSSSSLNVDFNNRTDDNSAKLVFIALNGSQGADIESLIDPDELIMDTSVGMEWTRTGTACEDIDANPPPLLDDLSQFIYSVLMPIVCLLGSICALICVFIFTRRQMRCSLSVYLAALSSFDFVLLVCATIIYPSMNLCLHEGNRGPVCHFFWRTSLATYPISLMAQTASVWTVVAITIDRYLAVKYPLHMRAWCTAYRARTVIFCITIVAILFKMPSFFEVALNECGQLMKTELRADDLYIAIYYTYGYLLMMLAAPFLFIIVLNARVLSIIRKANLQRCEMRVMRRRTTRDSRGSGPYSNSVGGGRGSGGSWVIGQLAQQNGHFNNNNNNNNETAPMTKDHSHHQTQQTVNNNTTAATNNNNNVSFLSNSLPNAHDSATATSTVAALDSRCTKMAVVTISAFVAFNWLAGINHVIEAFNLVDDDGPKMRIPIGNFLVCLNSATNILIYSLFGRRFRHQFCRMFCPCLLRKYDPLNRSIGPNKTADLV